MSILQTLTVSEKTKGAEAMPKHLVVRKRFLAVLEEQAAAAKAAQAGEHYTRSVVKTVKNAATGESERKTVSRRFRPMWWQSGDTVMLSLTYALRPVKIGTGNSIVVGEIANLVPTIMTVARAVEAGELDLALKAASDGRKRGGRAKKDGKAVGDGSGTVMLTAAAAKKVGK